MRVPKNQPFSYEIEKRSLKLHFIFRFPRNWKAVFGLQFLFSMSSKNGKRNLNVHLVCFSITHASGSLCLLQAMVRSFTRLPKFYKFLTLHSIINLKFDSLRRQTKMLFILQGRRFHAAGIDTREIRRFLNI